MTYFKGKCGEDRVQNHKYNISTKDGKSLVHANNWSSIVKKGTVLVMCMIVEKLALDQEHRNRNTCPHCDETDLGVMADEGCYTGKNYHCLRFLLLNLGDYSRRCERNFVPTMELSRFDTSLHTIVLWSSETSPYWLLKLYVNYLNLPTEDASSHPLLPSPACTWTW